MLTLRYPRDLVMIGAIFGVATMAWTGWAQEGPPSDAWAIVLGILSVLGIALAALSIPLAIRNWRAGTAIEPKSMAFRVYLVVFWVEIVIAAVGGIILPLVGLERLVAPYILLIVGVHFFALAVVFKQNVLHLAGAVLVVVAVIAAIIPTGVAANSFWCGIVGGPVFLIIGAWCTVAGRRVLKAAKAAATPA
ncbi:hypothetical protein HII28_10770 [Planctomonas sp. JC2975]|uniref:hypothetical protein n=1 Tax=Planctomonas sp. JC2975 TaxID=2729626 RepID=UPI001474EBC4|nr:hypothetical protein [Planctomonas sp. JC2975]NNC12357.1 hypothetical protein [Planctomonas sp. JC2975]